MAVLEVIDSGEGIPEKDRERVVERLSGWMPPAPVPVPALDCRSWRRWRACMGAC